MSQVRWVLIAALVWAAGAGVAFADDDQEKARRLLEAGEILPLEQILEKARGASPGRVLEVELEEEKTGFIYELEILDASGVVHDLRYDAKTGEPLGEREDDRP